MAKIFDWRNFLAANSPSKDPMASPFQQKRQRLMDERLVPGLSAWSNHHNLTAIWGADLQTFQKRLRYSAFACAFRTYDPDNETQTWLAAHFSFWVWAIDHFIDQELLPFLYGQDCSIEQNIAYLDEHLAAIFTEPLYTSGPLTDQEAQAAGLRPIHSGTTTHTAWEVPPFLPDSEYMPLSDEKRTQHTFHLKEALVDIYQSLSHHLASIFGTEELISISPQTGSKHAADHSSQNHALSKSLILGTFTREVAKLMSSMRSETIASLHFHCKRHIPDLETYLSLSVPSMHLLAQAALAQAFERDVTTSCGWDRWFRAMICGSRAIRLINDCATCIREMEEGKLSSITIALDLLGYPVDAQYTWSSPELQEALTFIRNRLNAELVTFESAIPTDRRDVEALTPLGFCILATVSYAMALYQQKDLEMN